MTNDQHCECDRRQTTRRLSEADNFFDGTSGVHDFTDIIAQGGTMVEPLQDPDLFKREFISMGVLTWPNGFDLDAIRLLQEMKTLFFRLFPRAWQSDNRKAWFEFLLDLVGLAAAVTLFRNAL